MNFCVFCGSRHGAREEYRLGAAELGNVLANKGIGLVYGGGQVGLMGVIADAVLHSGGKAFGVIPRSMAVREVAHGGLTEQHVVEGMHPRKAKMAALSQAFIAMPGGFGTFEELFEVVTWSQLGFHQKPVGILNLAGYFSPFLQLMENGISQGFIPSSNRRLVIFDDDPERLVDALVARIDPRYGKLFEVEET